MSAHAVHGFGFFWLGLVGYTLLFLNHACSHVATGWGGLLSFALMYICMYVDFKDVYWLLCLAFPFVTCLFLVLVLREVTSKDDAGSPVKGGREIEALWDMHTAPSRELHFYFSFGLRFTVRILVCNGDWL
jgi:hypothetical protein